MKTAVISVTCHCFKQPDVFKKHPDVCLQSSGCLKKTSRSFL